MILIFLQKSLDASRQWELRQLESSQNVGFKSASWGHMAGFVHRLFIEHKTYTLQPVAFPHKNVQTIMKLIGEITVNTLQN